MNLKELDSYFRSFLAIDDLAGTDISLNGVQVENDADITCIAFAVDACMETFRRAKEAGAQMVFVHHGLFWGHEQCITGSHYQRIRFLLENNIALYAAHLPLDIHPDLGNNAALAKAAGLTDLKPFGEFRGIKVGFKGTFQDPVTTEEVLSRLGYDRAELLACLSFGKEKNLTGAVITGGGEHDVEAAIDEDVDLYITGDAAHDVYHDCLENKINMISAGHYQTEVYGVQNVAKKVSDELALKSVFIDVPTGL
ncbi:MAG: Nif3-like dinuclear metal center hexameric protein [Spirochaetia bacterium]|nr:Nif3-like dinuclear metal center hexameric protein [Spirochaetia bacterium]